MWFTDLGTPFHQQDTNYYCGAACAQMILDSIGSGLLDQTYLYNINHAHSAPGWYTSPSGLNYTLNALMPPPPKFDSFFIVEVANTELAGSENIVRTLRFFRVATATLVWGTGHWVVVRGAKTTADPAQVGVAYAIEGFYINNPWPPTPSASNPALAPPPPHADPDACGTGGARGIANEYVTYSDWQSSYFTGGDAFGVGYAQFVSVCDPRRPPMGAIKLIGRTRLADGLRLISRDEALAFATRGLQAHNLKKEDCPLSPALRQARPATADLVQRLDRRDEFYYLVTLHTDGKASAVVRADALDGSLHGALALTGDVHTPIIGREAAVAAAKNARIDFGDGFGAAPLREGAYSVHPTLVWRPCRESRSPYYPFHMITIGARSIFVGYDGQVFPELTDLGRG